MGQKDKLIISTSKIPEDRILIQKTDDKGCMYMNMIPNITAHDLDVK
jgi:hypothetical protein